MKLKRIVLSLLLLAAFCYTSYAQQAVTDEELQQRFNNGLALMQQARFSEAYDEMAFLLQYIPDQPTDHLIAAWCQLNMNNLPKAQYHAERALQFDPLSQSSYSVNAYVAYATNRQDEGNKFLKAAVWLAPNDENQAEFIKDFEQLVASNVRPDIFQGLITKIKTEFATRDRSLAQIEGYLRSAFGAVGNGDTATARKDFTNALTKGVYKGDVAFMKGVISYVAACTLSDYGYWDMAIPFYEKALDEFNRLNYTLAVPRARLATRLGTTYQGYFNQEKAELLLEDNLDYVEALPAEAWQISVSYYIALCEAKMKLQKFGEMKPYAQKLLAVSVRPADEAYYKMKGYNFLGVSGQKKNALPTEINQSKADFEKALEWAMLYNPEDDHVLAIKANLAYTYYLRAEKEKAYQLYEEIIRKHEAKGNLKLAQSARNNLGSLYYAAKNWNAAIPHLKRSIEITEQLRSTLTDEEALLNFGTEAGDPYAFLIGCYANTGNAQGAFEIQNKQRGRLLSQAINKNQPVSTLTLQTYQKLLKPEEAAIFYTEMTPGHMVINVITSSKAVVISNPFFEPIVKIKEKHLDRITKAASKPGYRPPSGSVTDASGTYAYNTSMADRLAPDDMNNMMELTRKLLQSTIAEQTPYRNEFLSLYYDFLIRPALPALAGVKSLIVFPDALLNFLPFEALTDVSGKYLVEQFDIRYGQSADVFSAIHSRKAVTHTKSILAFGGAVYEEMSEQAEPFRSMAQLVELQNKTRINALAGKSQREVYAALGFGKMNYLPGTLAEVQAIQKFFPTGKADVYTGKQMTESFVKRLSQNGQMGSYKVVHFATHGFALPEIPALSGVAMCIPSVMLDGEDGYLTAPELATLNMKAELAVLSACETGLGKIYGGEGVAGLTQSLLIGGANRALVSLWPVSDEGTMYFMTGLYQLTEQEGKTYNEAVDIMKRRFIAGEFGAAFTLPNIWAPFIHYGK